MIVQIEAVISGFPMKAFGNDMPGHSGMTCRECGNEKINLRKNLALKDRSELTGYTMTTEVFRLKTIGYRKKQCVITQNQGL